MYTATWSFTLREKHRLRVFENGVLRKLFRNEEEEVAGGWGRLQNEKLHNLSSSPNVISVIKSRVKWVRHLTHMGER
jgi:hypothetical protein